MKNHIHQTRWFAALAGVVFVLMLAAAHAQTYTWDDNAQGQLYLTCPGPVTFHYYWPNNNNWTQTYQTNGNCNGTAIVESAPSNWDPTPPLGLYPGGPGLQGVNVIIGGLVNGTNVTGGGNTFLSSGAHLNLNSLVIQTNGALSVGANWSIALNRIEFQGDGEITSGVGGFLIGNGGTMIKSGGTNSFDILNPTFTGTNDLFEVDSGTLIFPSGFGAVNLDGGTFVVSNNATLLLTVDSGATPMLFGNFTGAGGGTVLFNNGALTGGWSFNLPGNMFQWTGGTLEGTSTNAGVFNLTNSLGFHGARFYNNNLVNMADNSSLNCSSTGGAIYNNLGATFNIQGNSSFLNGGLFGFNNYGLFQKSAGAGTAQITMGLNNYGGTVEVDAGTMALNGIYITNATFVVSNGATLDLATVVGNFEIEGTLTGSGGGTVLMNNGTVSSSYPTTLNFPGSMFQWAGGKLGNNYNTETNIGILNVSGTVGISGYFANSGTMIQSGTGGIGNGNYLYNNTGAVYDIQNDGSVSVGTLYNYGLVKKSAGTNTSIIAGNFVNYGTNASLEVDSGTLALGGSGGNYFTNTTLVISNAATLDLAAVPSVNQGTEIEAYLNGIGGGTLLMTNGTLLCNQPTTINFPGSMFQWAGGRIGGGNNNMTNIGTLNVSGPVGINNYLVNNGMMIQSGSGAMNSGNQLQNNAGGIYNIQNDGGVSANNFYNYGLFEKTSGTGTSIIDGTFNNSGSIQVPSGVLLFTNGTFVQNAGTLQLSSSLSCQDTLQVNGGTVTGVGAVGNPGLDVSMAVNGGVLAPGNPFGTLTSGGHYGFSMGSTATLSVELGGANQFSQLAVIGGSAALAGTLNVTLTNGYTPAIGTQFQIVSGNRGSSTFSTLKVPHGISLTYSNAGVYLTVTSAVPAQVTGAHVSGTNFVFGFGTVSNQSYTVQSNPDLTTTNWTFYTNLTGDGSVRQIVVPATTASAGFFRVREP
jgi:hypothetical protein